MCLLTISCVRTLSTGMNVFGIRNEYSAYTHYVIGHRIIHYTAAVCGGGAEVRTATIMQTAARVDVYIHNGNTARAHWCACCGENGL